MTSSILINSLGQALFESCGQALLIYVLLQLFMQFFPGIGSKYRYDINYLALTIICCWFIANLLEIYLHNLSLQNYQLLLYSSGLNLRATHTATLLQQVEAFITTYAKYISGLYMIALLLQAFRLVGDFVHIHHIRKQENLSKNNLLSAKVDELRKKLKLVKEVTLYFSSQVHIPLTIGHLKPIIIFPFALINNLDNDQVEAILLHELAHIKRYDYLLNILQCIMETILCFNPFVWLISKTIREEREFCCDDMVIDEDCNNYSYSQALFIIAQQNTQIYTLAMASSGTKKYPLLNRIKRLNNMKTTDSLPRFHLFVVLAIAAFGLLLAWGIPQYSNAKNTRHSITKHIIHSAAPVALAVVPAAPLKPIVINNEKKKKITIDTVSTSKLNDTIKQHKTFKIVIEDNNGNKKEYSSVNDMPEADREAFLKANPSFDHMFMDSARFHNFKMDPEWQKQMAELGIKMGEQFNNPAWRRQMADMQLKLKEQFNSPEWKKQVADMHKQFDNPEWKKQMADMQEKIKGRFNSPEWKEQMADMQKNIQGQFNSPEWKKKMADMQKNIQAQFNSPEWKKQMADMHKQFNNPQWRKQMEEMGKKMGEQFNSPEWKKQIEDLKKQAKEMQDKGYDDDDKKASQDSTKAAGPAKP